MTILQADSTEVVVTQTEAEAAPSPIQTEARPEKPRHPYQVLRSLPRDATPAQQDSAIQAVFQPEVIARSTRPDTLSIPGFGKGRDYRDTSLPTYYRENFFSNDTLYYSELNGGRYGVAGDPVPYTMRGDNVITSLLLICFVLALTSLSFTRGFIYRQAKNFFFTPKIGVTTVNETTAELRLQFFLILLTCLLASILSYFYTRENVSETFILTSQYQLIGIFFGIFVAYFLCKTFLYWIVNGVFFSKKKNGQWIRSLFFMFSMEGVALFPLVLLQVYFDFSIHNAVIYSLIVIILVKILSFYKCYTIFFRRIGVFLQIILYFCALEIIPLLSLGGILVMTSNYLKINY